MQENKTYDSNSCRYKHPRVKNKNTSTNEISHKTEKRDTLILDFFDLTSLYCFPTTLVYFWV